MTIRFSVGDKNGSQEELFVVFFFAVTSHFYRISRENNEYSLTHRISFVQSMEKLMHKTEIVLSTLNMIVVVFFILQEIFDQLWK